MDVTAGSTRSVWWKCTKVADHEWQAAIYARVAGNGCGCCHGLVVVPSNCLANVRADVAKLWHPTKNSVTPLDVTSSSGCKIWWKCLVASDHEWQASPKSMGRKSAFGGCPYCRGLKVTGSNCFATTHPSLSIQWHPSKNGSLTPFNFTAGSHKLVWWKCPVADDHEWRASLNNRLGVNKTGCPFCSSPARLTALSNCLTTTHPSIARQWHPSKNEGKTPDSISYGHNGKVWWMCDTGHEWRAAPNARSYQKQGCPVCNESKGEKAVRQVLCDLGVVFTEQHTLLGCRYKKKLPFDFAILKEGKTYLIEFNGIQHYEKTSGGWKVDFAYQVLRDRIKREYCETNGIPLLVIPYWEMENVKTLVVDFLNSRKEKP